MSLLKHNLPRGFSWTVVKRDPQNISAEISAFKCKQIESKDMVMLKSRALTLLVKLEKAGIC